MAHVVVLGGGFGGLAAVHELRLLLGQDDRITLVDRNDRFYMGFAKLWDLARLRPLEDGTVRLADVADDRVTVEQAGITAIDPTTRTVETTNGTLQSDAVLVALGAGPSPRHAFWLRGEGAHDLYDGEQLPAMHGDLDTIEQGRIVISIFGGPFKCPPAPYEAALIVADRLRQGGVGDDVEVVLTTPQPMTLPAAGPDASRYVAQHLSDHGVELREQHRITDVDADSRTLTFDGQQPLSYDLLLGVPANVPPQVVAESAVAGDGGWIFPDRHTLRTGFDGVYAVGDCTTIPTATGALPKAGVFAAAEARVAARNIAAGLGIGDGDRFDGHGYCFLELPGEQVAYVEGDFYADPPDVTINPADHDQFLRKQAYERDHLQLWVG